MNFRSPTPRSGASFTRPLFPIPEGLESLRLRLGIVGFWAVLGMLETAKELVVSGISGGGQGVASAFLVNFVWWFFWAPATFLIVGLCLRFPLWGGRGVRAAAVHTVAAALLALTQLAVSGANAYFVVVRGGDFIYDTLGLQIRFWMQGYLVLAFFTYWMIVGGYHAFLFRHRYVTGKLREAELEARAARAETLAVEARLQALGRELNPHFLFNALNGVAGLVESGNRPDAQRMLARISELLRSTLRLSGVREIPLREELEAIEEYLAIERVRFGDRLRAEIELGAGVGEALVPPLILQPIVENGILHGIAEMRGPGSLRVEGVLEGDEVRIRVEDSGPGPGPERSGPSRGEAGDDRGGGGQVNPESDSSSGVGLRNVRERLAELYPSRSRLTIEGAPGGGCRVELRLPFHTQNGTGASSADVQPKEPHS